MGAKPLLKLKTKNKTLNPHNFLPVRNDIICRGVKRYPWDILPITVKLMMTDTDWGFKHCFAHSVI